jgi:hypothetical protein
VVGFRARQSETKLMVSSLASELADWKSLENPN